MNKKQKIKKKVKKKWVKCYNCKSPIHTVREWHWKEVKAKNSKKKRRVQDELYI